jgi:hypothetical protein
MVGCLSSKASNNSPKLSSISAMSSAAAEYPGLAAVPVQLVTPESSKADDKLGAVDTTLGAALNSQRCV